ncbi:PFL1 [Auxenochlorella protothecoides x Auxenochlorella symbiontica]
MSAPTQQFTVRAAGSDHAYMQHFIGRFPLELPDLGTASSAAPWQMEAEEIPAGLTRAGPPPPRTAGPKPRRLRLRREGVRSYRGMPEGGLGSNQFLLVKERGSNDFVAIPVEEWYNFRPETGRPGQTLEAAEAAMAAARQQHDRVNPRFVAALQASGADVDAPALPSGADRDEDGADSDEEWKGIKARAASHTAPQAARKPLGSTSAQRHAGGGGEDEGPDDKAEDWDHEDEAADDDLDMEADEGEGGVEASPVRSRRPMSDSDDEGAARPEAVRRTIKKMMRDTGLRDSDAEDSDLDDLDDEDDSDDEDLDGTPSLDNLPAVQPPADPTPAAKRPRVEPGAAASGAVTEEEVRTLLQARGRMPLKEIVAHFRARATGDNAKAFTALMRRVVRLDPTPSPDGQKYLILA